MFSITANTMYSIDENGKRSLEISYCDSDGVAVGAYSEGDNFEDVILDAVDQIDEAIAEYDDDQADIEEASNIESQTAELQDQIAELQAQIAELQARNDELKQRHAQKINSKASLDEDLDKILNKYRKETTEIKNKISDFPFTPKWWV